MAYAYPNIELGTRTGTMTTVSPLEDSPQGYPRFSALVGAHDSFQICRRFLALRVRLLLMKQDKLTALEEDLHHLDQEERCGLFLGSFRSDRNLKRKEILNQVDTALAEYGLLTLVTFKASLMTNCVFLWKDSIVARNHDILKFGAPKQRDVLSLQNWIAGNACISRKETAYLAHFSDLLCVGTISKDAIRRVEEWIEAGLIRFYQPFRQSTRLGVSRDPNVFIYSGRSLRRISYVIVTLVIVFLILLPVITITILDSGISRMIIIVFSSAAFIMALSGLSNADASEMFIAGATFRERYATVLVVFLAGNGAGSQQ
ncbi:MAG: hypothetical protein Q9167_005441 [Letrouitia subvulpina]